MLMRVLERYLKAALLPRLATKTVGAYALSEAGSGSDAADPTSISKRTTLPA